MSDETEKTDKEDIPTQQMLLLYGEIYAEMLKSDRFKTFINTNFDIHREIDEEHKILTYRVIEVPPEEVGKRIAALVDVAKDEAAKKVGPKKLIEDAKATPAKDFAKALQKKVQASGKKEKQPRNRKSN